MGGGVSKYRMTDPVDGYKVEAVDAPWLAARDTVIEGLKADAFRSKTALGKGKFGVVFLSEHIKAQKHVAIKYVSLQLVHAGKHATRIERELDVLKAIDHPFVVHYFGCFQTPAAIAMVFAFTPGGELFMRMKQKDKMTDDEAKFYICEIALAIHYLHDKLNIVYRDLKPENVLIDCNGNVKICDFGFACRLSSTSQLGDTCGSVMYLAPEIASGNGKHGYPVDWWSVGCILYELVTGSAPFGDLDKNNKFEILNNINGKSLMYPIFMSSNLKKLITGLLQKDAKKRFKWSDFGSCAWVGESNISWQKMLDGSVVAPWIPEAMTKPTTRNFLPWPDVQIPTAPVSKEKITSAVDGYYFVVLVINYFENNVNPQHITFTPLVGAYPSLFHSVSPNGHSLTSSTYSAIYKSPSVRSKSPSERSNASTRSAGVAGGQRKEPSTAEAVKALESGASTNIKPASGSVSPTTTRRKEGKIEGSQKFSNAPLTRKISKMKSFSNGSEVPGMI